MHLPTHALIGWAVANVAPSLDRRGRAIAFFASMAPDLDALSILGGREAFQRWHHPLCHNVLFAAIYTAIGAAACKRRRATVAALALLNIHLHFACDLLGAAGPDGSHWTIPYFLPLSSWQADNPWMWALNAWQNQVVTVVGFVVAIWIARRHGRTPLEPFSLRADRAVMEVIDRRLGRDPRRSILADASRPAGTSSALPRSLSQENEPRINADKRGF